METTLADVVEVLKFTNGVLLALFFVGFCQITLLAFLAVRRR